MRFSEQKDTREAFTKRILEVLSDRSNKFILLLTFLNVILR